MSKVRWDLVVMTTAMFVFLIASVENPLWFISLMITTPVFYAFCMIDPNEQSIEEWLAEDQNGGVGKLNLAFERNDFTRGDLAVDF